jgi:hypothetical protein
VILPELLYDKYLGVIDMIKVTEISNVSKFREILSSQGYTINYVIRYVIDKITDYDKYRGIYLAYDSEYSNIFTTQKVKDFAEDIVFKHIMPAILEVDDYSYDFKKIFDKVLKSDEVKYDLKRFDQEFTYLANQQKQEWQDQIDELNKRYWK